MANVKKVSLVGNHAVNSKSVAKTTKSVDLKRLSDDEIEDSFRRAFEDTVVLNNDFGGETDFDVKVVREPAKNTVKIEATVQGLAGSVNAEDFKKGKVKKADLLVDSMEKKGDLTFTLVPRETTYNSSTEYTVVYIVQ